MNATAIGLTVGIALLGLLVILIGIFPSPEDPTGRPPGRLQRTWTRRRDIITPRVLIAAGIGLVVGIVLWLISGWPITILVGPALAIVLPLLVGSKSDTEDIDKLQALEIYTRNLAGIIGGAGTGLEVALPASVRTAPPAIQPAIERLAARLTSRWTIEDALRGLATDLNDATGDLIVAHLQLAAKERGPGLTKALQDLADDVFDEVKARRQVAADRAKPQQTIRLITIIVIGMFVGLPLLGGSSFFAFYGTPFGQIVLLFWVAIYVTAIIFLKQWIRPRPMPRILNGRS